MAKITDTNATLLAQMINPQVLADMVSAKLPNLIRFRPVATIGRELQGQPGTTLTVPKFIYIGDATDCPEGEAIPVAQLTKDTTSVTVKKIGRAAELTDEAVLSGYGDPVGEVVKQLAMAHANKIDNDCLVALRGAALTSASATAKKLTASDVIKAKAKFGEQVNQDAVLFVNTNYYTQLVLDPAFQGTEKLAQNLVTGAVGVIGGCQVVISDKLLDTEAYILADGALEIQLKRGILMETTRKAGVSTTYTGTEHYAAWLRDESKAVKITIAAS